MFRTVTPDTAPLQFGTLFNNLFGISDIRFDQEDREETGGFVAWHELPARGVQMPRRSDNSKIRTINTLRLLSAKISLLGNG